MKKIIIPTFVFLCFFSPCIILKGAELSQKDKSANYDLYKDVAVKAAKWMDARRECYAATENLLKADNKDEINASFIAAKLLWLSGSPSEAIKTLETVIKNKKTDIAPGLIGMPILITGNFWIAAIWRQAGELKKAETVYDRIIEIFDSEKQYKDIAVYCWLYKAEIETITGEKEKAIKTLSNIKTLEKPQDKQRIEMWEIFQKWADYKTNCVNENSTKALRLLDGNKNKLKNMEILAITQLSISGILFNSFDTYCSDSNRNIFFNSLTQAIEYGTGEIDKGLARYLQGSENEKKGIYNEAVKYYGELFESDSFFAPEGGILLSTCLKKQGKNEDAQQVLNKLKDMFPGYAKLADKEIEQK